MKKLRRILSLLPIAPLLYTPIITTGCSSKNDELWKAYWFYQYSDKNTIYKDENGNQRSKDDYTAKVDQILDNIKNYGFNTIFVQMLSHGNAMFPSNDLLPSPYSASGPADYSTELIFSYDPMQIFVDEAHKRDIAIHAWLNPMRLLTESEFANAAATHKYDNCTLIQWYNDTDEEEPKNGTYMVKVYDASVSENRYYLNPAYEDVRNFITHEAVEVANRYDLDGVHWDDYFYPPITQGGEEEKKATDLAFDQIAFNDANPGRTPEQKADLTSRRAWRRDNVNKLVAQVYAEIKNVSKNLQFGIAPACKFEESQQGYLCADVACWASHDYYVDYLMPELYITNYCTSYGEESYQYRFNNNYETWKSIFTNDDVDFYVGINVNHCCTFNEKDLGWWTHNDNVITELKYMAEDGAAKGFTLFDYYATFNKYETTIVEGKEPEISKYLPAVKDYPNI